MNQLKLNKAKKVLKELNKVCNIDYCFLTEYELLAIIYKEL